MDIERGTRGAYCAWSEFKFNYQGVALFYLFFLFFGKFFGPSHFKRNKNKDKDKGRDVTHLIC